MSEKPLYWSAEYTQAFVAALNESAAFQKAAKKFDDRIVFRCLDTPQGEDVEVTYTIRNGQVTADRRAETAPSSAIRNAPFDKKVAFARSTAPFDVWVKLDKGEMNPVQAIASPDYQVEGPKLKIMRNIGMFNAMSSVGSETPKRYA
ncbi:MAG TPA: SCP2 sterol-binding domain-containing protein [Sandaracinaceae bacterium LLY-WYZ-13_1]|nr:SCP2 sterol-binding domain-containing protein [Sandaracinaceae bacterium LLY-WYZ-13_1]